MQQKRFETEEEEEESASPEDMEAICSTAETKKEGQDEMATYERLQQRALLQVR